MITLSEYFTLIDYKITESGPYLWKCFGPNALTIDSWSGDQDGYAINVIFDSKNQTVYCVEACDYKRNRAFRLINPDFVTAYYSENKQRQSDDKAWDDVSWTDIELKEDFITKAEHIINDTDYDLRVSIPIELSDEELFHLMKQAHERDITFNKLVEEILTEVILKENGKIKSS